MLPKLYLMVRRRVRPARQRSLRSTYPIPLTLFFHLRELKMSRQLSEKLQLPRALRRPASTDQPP